MPLHSARPHRAAGRRSLLALLILSSLLAAVLTTVAAPSQARSGQDPTEDFPQLPGRCFDEANDRPVSPCRLVRFPRRPTVFLWGDSHAWMYLPAVRKLAQSKRVNLTVMFAGGCPPTIPLPREPGDRSGYCEQHNVKALDLVTQYQRLGRDFTVVLGSWWSGYRQAYRRMQKPDAVFTPYEAHIVALAHGGTEPLFDKLARRRIPTDVIGPSANVPIDPQPCSAGRTPYMCNLPRHVALNAENRNRQWLKQLMRPLVSARYIDATSVYCDASTCHPTVDGTTTFFDDIHLGARLTSTMTSFFRPTVEALLKRSR